MREKSIPQRLLSLLLACVICLTCAPTAYAESAVAASMRLMKTEGTVSVSNSSGRTVTQTERMSLRSGYQLETAEKSYAWINLDDVKLAEMDAVTEIGIRKKGKKLDILVESGSLLFKVDEPLEGDENLNIRTSTMAIGVRGTCGWVKVIDQWTSRIYILEGSVEASVSDPVSGEVKTETISAGEMAICTVYPQDRSGSKCDIVRQDFTVADIDGFVLVELTPDKTVCDKIYEESGLDLRDPSVKPAEKLKQDQEKVRDQLAEIDNRVQEQENNIAVDPVWTDPAADDKITVPATPNGGTGTGGGGTGGGGNGGGSTPAPTETVTLVMPQTAAAVNQELARSTVRQVVLLPGTARTSTVSQLEVDSALTVPAGKTLTLQNGVGLILLANQPLAVHGTLSVGEVCYLFGNLTAGSGAVIKAKGFSLDMPDHMAWERSAEPDANGFYFLTYIGKTFTVTFEANGGSVTPSSARTGSGGKLASLPTPVREGYTFAGWFTAAEGGTRVTTSTVFTDNAAIYAHWSESEDLDWRYDQPTKTLYITGTGPMEAYPSENHVTQAPWSMYAAEMRAVVIDSGVESVGHRAFEGCSNLQSVVLPSSVTSIGDSAFAYCTSLNSIALPNGLRSIAPYAFFQCTELRDVQIPRSTTAIGQAAFGQSGLTSVTVPGSVMGLDNMTFISCYNLTTATLEQGVATVAEQVFNNCSSLQTLYLPASLSSIGDESFIGNPALSDVYFDGTEAEWSGVSVLGNNASLLNAAFHFKDGGEEGWRYDETTKTLYILGSGPMVDYPTSINRPWYQYREEIQSVVIENGITSIGDSAFCECGSLTSVTIPNSVTSIGDVAFYECGSLTRVTIPDSVTSIGETAFWKCTALTSVTIPNRVATIGGRAFMECSSLTSITIPDSVTSIGFAAFSNCGSLASVTLPKGIASISESAFADCHSLTSVTIPDSVTLIGNGAFARCDGLTSVTIPASVAGIGDYAFDGCAKLTDVYYGGTAAQWETVEIGIRNDPLRSANIHFNGGEDEWRYDEATKTLYITGSGPMKNYGDPNDRPWSQYTEEIQSVIIENGITSIGSTAFYFCTSLTSATIPDSVTSVEQYAFRGDASLKDVYYGGDEAQWEAITLGNGNDPLRNATIHFNGGEEGVTWRYDEATKTLYITGSGPMDDYDFATGTGASSAPWVAYAGEMQSLVIADGITSIGNYAFYRCTGLTGELKIPASVTSIGEQAFYGCSGLTNAAIPDGVTSIAYSSFAFCSGLTNVTIPNSVTSIANDAFRGTSLTSVTIPDGVTSIGNYVFVGCESLTSVTLSNSVTRIGASSFYNCNNLTDVYYSGTETEWNAISIGARNEPLTTANIHFNSSGEEGEPWRYDEATKTLYITGSGPMEDYVNILNRPWDQYRSEIQSVVIENGVTSIGNSAFRDFTNLTSVSIPDNVTSIGNSAFYGCSKLTSVDIPVSVTSIGHHAFHNCTYLLRATIPDGVTNIDDYAFAYCIRLTSVNIPNSVTSIGNSAFSNCTNLSNVYYGGTETQWNAINIGTYNDPLTTATIHYNSRTRSVVSNAGTAGYTDVPAGAAYAEAVNYCKVNNLMTGTSATEFSPNGTLTRAMMVTVLHRLAGKPAASSTASFADVPAGKWYTDAISWANSKGIVLGYNAATFGVNDPVTHEQVALIFQRYSGDPTVQTEGADSPKTPATRAEIAVTLMNFARSRKPGTLSVLSAIDVMCAPSGIAVDQNGVLLVTDLYNKQVWKVLNRAGTAYAGGATVPDLYGQPLGGYNDGNLTGSYFKEPWAVAPFLDGWAVSDTANNAVRLVTGGGIQTLNTASKEKLTVTNLGVAFNRPTGLAADEDGNLYVADTGSGTVRRVSPQGGVSTVAKGLSDPTGLCWKDGALYIAETGRNRILQLKDGKITVLAGSGSDGSAGGRAAQASFSAPQGVAVGEDGSVYVADTGNGAVRMIKSGTVSTLAVRDPAQLSGDMISPVGLLLQGGSLYVCDPFVRKIFVLAVA